VSVHVTRAEGYAKTVVEAVNEGKCAKASTALYHMATEVGHIEAAGKAPYGLMRTVDRALEALKHCRSDVSFEGTRRRRKRRHR